MASLSRTADGEPIVSVVFCYLGQLAEGERLLWRLWTLVPESDDIRLLPYRAFQRALNDGFPPRQQHYWMAGSLTELDATAIDVMVDFVKRMPSPNSGVGLRQLHGAASRVDATATAYPHREQRYDFLIFSQWPDPLDSPRNIGWTREFFDAMAPFCSSGVYLNNLGDAGDARVKQAYGPNYDRLVALKTKYDPTNLFRHNQNIAAADGG
jgi:hypothetical protein